MDAKRIYWIKRETSNGYFPMNNVLRRLYNNPLIQQITLCMTTPHCLDSHLNL